MKIIGQVSYVRAQFQSTLAPWRDLFCFFLESPPLPPKSCPFESQLALMKPPAPVLSGTNKQQTVSHICTHHATDTLQWDCRE